MSQVPLTPSVDELRDALVGLRHQNPTLGATKLHSVLVAEYPHWTVSEKRTRKVLQQEGLVLQPVSSQKEGLKGSAPVNSNEALPTSRIVEGLDLLKWTPKVEAKYFGRRKGKGLVAREKIAEGEVVWKEEPFILAPEWEIYDLQISGLACAFCSTPLGGSPLIFPCSFSSSAAHCPARFCNRLCLSRSARTHPLLCPAQNPMSIGLVAFARQNQWMALHALAQCTARTLLMYQQDEAAGDADWHFVQSMAQLGMEQRANAGWLNGAEPNRATWKKAYELYVHAFREPPAEREKKRLARILRKPAKQELVDAFFTYDAFLLGLGRMSLNLEAHGGLYVLHSHINHSCDPNISVRHLDQRIALARITVIARRDIEVGEELLITYVDPSLPVEQRRRRVMEWGFGECRCERCMSEEADPRRHAEERNMPDLEMELKVGLGVM